jgi:bacillithiol system protein YtxJ
MDTGKLDELVAASANEPVIIFKHSNTCGISADLYEQVSALDRTINLVTVQISRGISNEIESRLGIRHQSPQAFVIKDGKAVYHASHYAISPKDIEKHLQ